MRAYFVFAIHEENDGFKTPLFSVNVLAPTWLEARGIVSENVLPGYWFSFHGTVSLQE